MLISTAYAAGEVAAQAPSAMEAFALNMLLIVILVILFYVLLIMPQQKRFKQHRAMMDDLKKGDEIVTGGGFLATIDKVEKGEDHVTVELAKGVKVKALRSTIQSKVDKSKV